MAGNLPRIYAVVVLTCVPAYAATGESSTPCTAKLPNGAFAELVGLRCLSGTPPNGFKGDRFQWWKPDGAPLTEPPDKATTSMSYNDAYVLVLRVTGSPDCSCIAVGPWNKDADSADLWLKGQRSGPPNDLRRFWLRFNRDQRTADIRVGMATGAWDVVQEWSVPEDATPDDMSYYSEEEVVLRCPVQARQDVVAEVTHGFADEATRLLILDQESRPHTSTSRTAGRGGSLVRYVHRFENLQREDLKRIEFQKRPYDCWITFRNVSLRPGQRTQVQVEVEQMRTGLAGGPLPRFNVPKIDSVRDKAQGQRILLCFWDVGQRPSRNCIQELAKMQGSLAAKRVSVILVHLATPGDNPPEEWLEKNRIPLLTGTLGEGRAQARQIWGVQVLPWLILTDDRHNVTAEGFPLSELNQELDAKGGTKQ